jgi:signal peptidase I
MSEFPPPVPSGAPRLSPPVSDPMAAAGPASSTFPPPAGTGTQSPWAPQVPPSPPDAPPGLGPVGPGNEPGPPPPPGPPPRGPQPPPGSASPGAPSERPAGVSRMRGVVEWAVIIAVALIGAVLMRTFLIQAFFIPSESMVPTLEKGDRVLVNKLSYRLHPVHRGDIVVFTRTPGKIDPAYKDLIKRVIGLPGDTVEGRGGHVYINGHLLYEPYLPAGTDTSKFSKLVIPPNMYWVMGDNRTNSSDSRVFGPIAKHQIVGRAFVLWWPLSRVRLL